MGGWLALASAFAIPSRPFRGSTNEALGRGGSRWGPAAAAAAAAVGAGQGTCAPPTSLREQDEEVWRIIEDERARQVAGIELIASENFVSRPVLEALGSVMTNKYSEGRPGARYYGGNEHVDKLERLCEVRSEKNAEEMYG